MCMCLVFVCFVCVQMSMETKGSSEIGMGTTSPGSSARAASALSNRLQVHYTPSTACGLQRAKLSIHIKRNIKPYKPINNGNEMLFLGVR